MNLNNHIKQIEKSLEQDYKMLQLQTGQHKINILHQIECKEYHLRELKNIMEVDNEI